jgi:hypothetical protein
MREIINKYNPETIPEGAHVSMGMEYEVTPKQGEIYNITSSVGYTRDIGFVTESANLGIGGGGPNAIYEFYTKPTYNPYLLIAEMKLLQEAEFFDLNFRKYSDPEVSRGYHLNIVGDSGLKVNKDMYFLHNVLTMTQLAGAIAGEEVVTTRSVNANVFEYFSSGREQKGDRCEIKGMACDTIEQSEQAILTAHHAGIAVQLCNKYLPEGITLVNLPDTAEQFEEKLIKTAYFQGSSFESDQERDIVYEWMKFKRGIIDAVAQHNESFIDSELNGFAFNKQGEYIDTSEHINIVRNKKLATEEEVKSGALKEKLHINTEAIFESQSPEFVNSLVRINNFFLKPPQAADNSPVNAKSVLDTKKRENYGGIVGGEPQDSIFDTDGNSREGYYYIQDASEEMISHKSQILLNRFNKRMEELLQTQGILRVVKENELVNAS